MNILQFITAGNSTFTVENLETGNRFTYKIKAPCNPTNRGGKVRDYESNARFVSVLTGPDNDSDYQFLGTIFLNNYVFRRGKNSKIGADAISFKAFDWTFKKLESDTLPDCIEINHSGNCGRCGRTLTVPESIKSGFGPECITKIGV